ncbi:MAG: hypothetical protein SNJ77_04930 [Cytophagales bacterium]
MVNDPELNGKFLGLITQDFVKVADFIKEVSYQMRVRNFTKHPVFVMTKEESALGSALLKPDEKENSWFYNASMMEELGAVFFDSEDSLNNFMNVYKDADEYCCLFVATPEFMNFIFLPYPEDL